MYGRKDPSKPCGCTDGTGLEDRLDRRASWIFPPYITATRIARLGDDGEVVRDEQDRRAGAA